MNSSFDIVINDLSFIRLNSVQDAREKMSGLVQALSAFNMLGANGALRCSLSLFQSTLYDDYRIYDWINDTKVSKDEKSLFKIKATKSPYLQDEPLAEARSTGCDFRKDGNKCDALGAAYLLHRPALSLLSEACWDTDKIIIEVEELDEQGEFVTSDREIVHAASTAHVLAHRIWLREALSLPIKNGNDLWNNRKTLFPNLEFCVEVEKQLHKLTSPIQLDQVRMRLTALNDYDDEWTAERLAAILPEFTGESITTLNKYADLRIFSRSNGESIFCEKHMKMMRINWRIHFYVDFPNRKFIVGYIGPHLRI